MELTKQQKIGALRVEQFPLSSKYDPDWVYANEMGPNALWLAEWLCQEMDLKPGMRVLDMGCGMAMSSIFLAREFGVQVWANDLWIGATDNWGRIKEAGLEEHVFPIHAEAHSLPYADGFFDALVSLDSYQYYGTDDLYLGDHFVKLVKPGGQIGIVVVGLMREFEGDAPETLKGFWDWQWTSFHTPDWWRRHWQKTGLVDIDLCEALADGGSLWLKFEEARDAAGATKNHPTDAEFLRADQGRYLGLIRMVARRR